MTMNIFEKMTSPENVEPILIVEMSGNHGGGLKSAEEFIDTAISLKPDVIKFQVYTPDTITLNVKNEDFSVNSETIWAEHNSLYELYSIAHTPWAWIEKLAAKCDAAGQPWFASPFDPSAIEFLEQIGCPAYKIASPEINDVNLIDAISKTKKPVVVSCGLGSEQEIADAITLISRYQNNYALLKCTSAYPAPVSELNLLTIPYLREKFNCPVGFSDHSIGKTASVVAVALGATIIEKHFKLDDDINSVDSEFSMPLSELSSFKLALLEAAESRGEVSLDITKSAIPSLSGRRSLYVSADIKAGDLFTEDNIKSVRPSFSLAPKFFSTLLGKQTTRDLKMGDRITAEAVKNLNIWNK